MYKFILSVCLYFMIYDVIGEEVFTECEWEGVKGRCVSPRRCLTTLDKKGSDPPVCGEGEDEPKICCTDCELVNDTSNAIISPTGGLFWKNGRQFRDNCLQYLKVLPHKCDQYGYYGGISRYLDSENQCHRPNVWAVGGAPPVGADSPSENPYEALMGFGRDLESVVWLTSGAIISDKFILTSAYGNRVKKEQEMKLKFVALGVKNRSKDKKSWQIHMMKKIHQYPEFGKEKNHNDDIALLELETPITFTKDILPACLPDPDQDLDISTAKGSSWKTPSLTPEVFSDTPEIVEVKKMSAEECDTEISNSKVNDATQLCYGKKKGEACLQIPGSPIVVNKQFSHCLNTVIGVSTYETQCDVVVYTNVAKHVDWIESIVWPSEDIA